MSFTKKQKKTVTDKTKVKVPFFPVVPQTDEKSEILHKGSPKPRPIFTLDTTSLIVYYAK